MKEDKIRLEHGGGGKLMEELIQEITEDFQLKSIGEAGLQDLDDGSSISFNDREIVVSTDSHVIKPLFFPGGDIGKLAVAGTVNDVSVMGAIPKALTFSLVVEEGFGKDKLKRIITSAQNASENSGVPVISGDTKVMPEGEIDGAIINTTGVGICERVLKDSYLEPGDKIIINGGIGEHGIAITAARDEYNFDTDLKSDVAPLNEMISSILEIGGIKAMKDPTRGGLSECLNSMASKSRVGIKLRESRIPVKPQVKGACEMLGFDPLDLPNEGKAVIGVESSKAEDVLEKIRNFEVGKNAEVIGEVTERKGKVYMDTEIGGKRVIQRPVGGSLPRIC